MRLKNIVKFGLLTSSLLSCVSFSQEFNSLDNATMAQVKIWQSGGRAQTIVSSDGKVIYPFGQIMPKVTCAIDRACDVEMEPGEKISDVILGSTQDWHAEKATSTENGKQIVHVIFQPRDSGLETNAIITTDHRTYHIKLFSPKTEGAYYNRVGFYYPDQIVSHWSDASQAVEHATEKDDTPAVTKSFVSPEMLAFDYRIDGSAEFKPLRVFNDGERTYMEMPDSLHTSDSPIFQLLDDKGNAQVVNYRMAEDKTTHTLHYIVDRLFDRAQLKLGDDVVKIVWKRKMKHFWE